ncbi:MAG: L,D-transpeptidase [Labilithrix sp.]|nr:L,D-transpeptidase [Labilithrix sp.]MCW5815280.1 L,D-transpeptidase [Labilithrix sp.]
MRFWLFLVVPVFGLVLLVACGNRAKHEEAVPTASDASTTAAELDAAPLGAADAGAQERRLVMQLAAANFVASVSDQPDWPENDAGARRMGYLRNGAVVDAYDPPVKNDECKDGWYELVTGGYVCGKHATIDLTNPRVRLAPKQPDRDAGMPYRYGVNVSDGTPLYRRVLNAEDRRRYEHPARPKPAASAEPASEAKEEEPAAAAAAEPVEPAPPAEAKDDEPPLSQEEEPPPQRKHTKDKHRPSAKKDKHAKKDKDEKKDLKPVADPFKDRSKGDRPSLKELKGRGVLVRKLARGFTIALDREFKGAGTRWWRTTFGFAVPFDRVAVQAGQTKHQGNWFNGANAVAPMMPLPAYPNLAELDASAEVVTPDAGAPIAGTVGFIMFSGASKLEIKEDEKGNLKVGWGAQPLPKRSAVLLSGRTQVVNGATYYETVGGFYVLLPQLKLTRPQIPADVGEGEKWIDVDVTRQQLVAFEGRRPVFATLISSGRKNEGDPEHNYATPPGVYRVREKHVTATMDADTAADGPYSIEDVPWVMYFQGSYALHGAFWHDSFGNQRSHGCVNMSPDDARRLFDWADPPLPNGWHGVFSKDDNSGSRVVVHEDPPPKRR